MMKIANPKAKVARRTAKARKARARKTMPKRQKRKRKPKAKERRARLRKRQNGLPRKMALIPDLKSAAKERARGKTMMTTAPMSNRRMLRKRTRLLLKPQKKLRSLLSGLRQQESGPARMERA